MFCLSLSLSFLSEDGQRYGELGKNSTDSGSGGPRADRGTPTAAQPGFSSLEADRQRLSFPVWVVTAPLIAGVLVAGLAAGLLIVGLVLSLLSPAIGRTFAALGGTLLAAVLTGGPLLPAYALFLLIGWILYFSVGGRPPNVRLALEARIEGCRMVLAKADVLPRIPKRRGLGQPGPPGRSERQFYGLVGVGQGTVYGSEVAVAPVSSLLGRFDEWEPGLRTDLKRMLQVPIGDSEFDRHFQVFIRESTQVQRILHPKIREGYTYALLPWAGFLEPSPLRRIDGRWALEKCTRDLRALLRVVYLAGLTAGLPAERLLDFVRGRANWRSTI
ncbi:MAG: hypothetical protein N0A24_09890 [Armatimonadetes bacterium]|nr:hypothetical protein [Armatimonadota bacterium]MDW8154489.1 hypothetical protein [Armatimonadota bacterium]